MPSTPRLVLALAAVALLAGCLGGLDDPFADPAEDGDPAEAGAAPAGLVPQSPSTCDRPLVEGVYAREPDLAADPDDRERLAAGLMVEIPSARGHPKSDEPLWSGLARSTDGGATWNYTTLGGYPGDPDAATSPFKGSTIVGDPVVEFLPDGTLLYMGLMIRADTSTTLFVARYPPGAMEPAEVSIVARGALPVSAGSKVPTTYQVAYNDKPYMAVDPDTGNVYAAWSWRGNVPEGSRAITVFSRSTDGGRTWSQPQPLVEANATYAAGDDFHVGAYPVVGTDGSVHVFWWEAQEGIIYHAVSRDQGETFTDPERLGQAPGGLSGTGSVLAAGLPQAGVDRSGGPDHGSVYVAWASGAEGDWDVNVRASRDGGRTWSDPALVHPADDGAHQVQPAVAVGPDGSISVAYYRIADASGKPYRTHLAYSDDGARSFDVRAVATAASDGEAGSDEQPVGDYMGVAYDTEGPMALWQDARMGSAEDPYSEAFLCELAPGS